jgi:NADPH-dependent 2,4-dienoyl-CoA reductase/sulfur reductase-like enzyme/rhodanese-related sulfurtransferase
MTQTIVIVGGVAGGASAAARARRLSESANIIVFERDSFISFANCGLPYHIGGTIEDRDKLLVQTPQSMKARFNLDIRIETEVLSIQPNDMTVTVRERHSKKEYTQAYDQLILSPGARAFVPPFPGADHPLVFTLRNIPDMDKIILKIAHDLPKTATVLGGGFIGLEMAEALVQRGIKTTLVELSNQVMAPVDPEMATPLHQEMRAHGVNLLLGVGVTAIADADQGARLQLSNGGHIDTDMVVMAIGVRPETSLAQAAGITLGARGGILVDDQMRTSAPNIYAVGDAIEVKDLVSGEAALVPLAGPANRQGRIAADVIFGRNSRYQDTQGTAICKVFDQTVAVTGLNEKRLKQLGRKFEMVYAHAADHANYYPGAEQISLKLLFDPSSGVILGAQALGKQGVDKRIDVIATMIRASMTVYDMASAELSYAPPYGSAKDIINQAGFIASNVMEGEHLICQPQQALDCADDPLLVDVREPSEIGRMGTIDNAINIPLPTLRDQLAQLPKDRPILVFCAVGLRGYVAFRILSQLGYQVRNLTGGYTSYLMVDRIGR